MIPEQVQKYYLAKIPQLIIFKKIAYRHKPDELFTVDIEATNRLNVGEKENEFC